MKSRLIQSWRRVGALKRRESFLFLWKWCSSWLWLWLWFVITVANVNDGKVKGYFIDYRTEELFGAPYSVPYFLPSRL